MQKRAPLRRPPLPGILPALWFLIACLVAGVALTGASLAQETASEAGTAALDTAAVRQALDEAAERLATGELDDTALTELRTRITPYISLLEERTRALAPRLSLLEARLAELRPAEGESLPSALEEKYAALQGTAESLQAEITLNRSLLVEASQVLGGIAAERQRLFRSRLLAHRPAVFSPAFYAALDEDLPIAGRLIAARLADWANAVGTFSPLRHTGTLLALLGIAIVAYALWNRLLTSRALRHNEAVRPATTVLVHFLVMSLALFLAIFLGNYVVRAAGYVPEAHGDFLTTLSAAMGLTVALLSLSKAVLDPRQNTSYLIPLPMEGRRRLHTLAAFTLSLALAHIAVVSGLQLAGVAGSILTLEAVIVSILLGIGFWRLSRALRTVGGGGHRLARLLAIFFGLAALLAPLASLLGYVTLSNFIIVQVVWITFIMVLAWLVMLWLGEQLATTKAEAEPESGLSRLLVRQAGVGHEGAQLVLVLLQGLGRLMVVFAAIAAITLPWGGAGESLFARIASNITEFDVGGLRISPLDILVALVIFALGLAVVRLVKHWFSHSFLPLTRFDDGIQNSLSTFAGYVGFILVVVITLAYLGVALQNLAIIAGALSVGIGFGLQSIVNNFVSGLILLAERPFKVGDWIVVGTEQGNVRRINVRATEIETFDRASIIVPNADLITGVVKNWTHSNRTGRIIVTVGVSYEADPEKVRDILLKCASEHEDILTYPEPAVFFQDFGDNALIFDLFAFLGAVDKSLGTKSDLRFAIYRELKAAGIAIPYPQRDVHLKGEVRLNAEGRPIAFTPDARGSASEAASPASSPQAPLQAPEGEEPDQKA